MCVERSSALCAMPMGGLCREREQIFVAVLFVVIIYVLCTRRKAKRETAVYIETVLCFAGLSD